MHAFTRDYFEHMQLPLYERLLKEAEAEERTARNFEGCMWMGTEHPSSAHRRRASDLRAAAAQLKIQAEAPQRRRETAEKRRRVAEQALQDAMHEDNDW